jgi:hypothetical protein
LATFGLFMGAVINANIFGELQVILNSIGIEEKEFQNYYTSNNSVMIHLNLPEEIQ